MTDPPPPPLAFLTGGGELGGLIATFDWTKTALGGIGGWPQGLKTVVSLILRSPVPIVTLWDAPGVMIYNDAYARFAGGRHPHILGSNIREAWPEVADFNDNVMKVVFHAGDTLRYTDQELVLERNGKPEPAWLNLDYSPMLDEAGRPIGVMAIVVETTEKVKAERRLSDERLRLAQLFEQGPGFMALVTGPDHVFELANPAYFRLVGNRELIGRPVRDAVPEVAERGYLSVLDKVFETGEPFAGHSLPVAVHHQGAGAGAQRHIDVVYQPITSDAGVVLGIFIQGTDVTDRVAAERAARLSDAQFLAFAQSMPHHVWTAPPDGMLDWFNERVYEYSGRTAVQLAGTDWSQIVHPDDREPTAARWIDALKSGSLYEAEFRIRRADGAYRWHLTRALPIRDESGAITRWIGTNTDIDDQRTARQALSDLNAMLEAEVEARTRERDRAWKHSRDLQLVLDGDGVIRAANDAWEIIVGYRPDEIVGRNYAEFVVTDDKPASDGALATAMRGPLLSFENRYRHKDGGTRWISWVAAPQDGVVYASGRHVTAEKEAAEALEQAQDALRQSQKMEAVGQLTGGIAHDFNNLLQGITGSLDLVQKRIAQGRIGELDRFITGAMMAANRAAALTHRLLAFSRRQPLDPRSVKTSPLIASMEDLLRRTLGENVDLELVLAGGLWLTLCDPNQLENAVLNLAINARDAMPSGGKLTIETCNAHLDNAYAASQRDVRSGQYVCICVTDTGGGMSAETVGRAFEPFFTTKPIGQGTGLGLSMIYGFARQSEGYAKIYSEVGKGTTVKLYLPRHLGDGDREEPLPELTPAHAPDAGETVLVVEDEPVVRGLIVEVLSDLGYRAIEASDGQAGLEILQSRRRIDLMITDIGLPGLNGRQVADAGRALRPELKVLFMTGYAENAALASGFLEPGMTMITKPFSMEALATRIRDIIGE